MVGSAHPVTPRQVSSSVLDDDTRRQHLALLGHASPEARGARRRGEGFQAVSQRKGQVQVDRKTLVEAATRLFRQHGYRGTSMKDLADEVNLLKGSLYNHIGSKEELLQEMLSVSVTALADAVSEVRDSEKDVRVRLRRLIEAEIMVQAEHHDEMVVWLAERDRLPESFAPISQQAREVGAFLVETIHEGIEAGVWTVPRPELAIAAIRGMLTGFVLWYSPDGRADAREIASSMADYASRILIDEAAAS